MTPPVLSVLKQVIHFINSIDCEKLQNNNCVDSVSLSVQYSGTPVQLKLSSLNNMNNSEQDEDNLYMNSHGTKRTVK